VIETILNGLLPVAFVILLGWLSCRIGLLKHDDAGVLATLVIRFALPLALFEGAVKTSPDKLENLGMAACLTLGLMGSYVIALAIGRFGFKHDLRTATMQALVCAFPDMAYFGADPGGDVWAGGFPRRPDRQSRHQHHHAAADHRVDPDFG
jgi:malonate transporter